MPGKYTCYLFLVWALVGNNLLLFQALIPKNKKGKFLQMLNALSSQAK